MAIGGTKLGVVELPFGCVPVYVTDETIRDEDGALVVTLEGDLTDVRSCE